MCSWIGSYAEPVFCQMPDQWTVALGVAGALAFWNIVLVDFVALWNIVETSSQWILLYNSEVLLKYCPCGYWCTVQYCWNIVRLDIVAQWNIVEILSWWILYHVEIMLKYHPDWYCCTVKYCWNIIPVNILARDLWFAIANHSQKSRSQTVITNNHLLQLLSSLRHNS